MLETVARPAGLRDTDAFVYTEMTDPRVEPILDDLYHEYAARYPEFFYAGSAASDEMIHFPAILFSPPGGAFLLLEREGEIIAGGAFMQIDHRTVELKRIWTSANHRRQGLSTLLLAELEAEAARRGFSRIYLTTGPRQPEAKYLYLKNGYTALFDLEADPETLRNLPFEKAIEPKVQYVRGLGDRIRNWQQLRAYHELHHSPILRRLDDLVAAGEV